MEPGEGKQGGISDEELAALREELRPPPPRQRTDKERAAFDRSLREHDRVVRLLEEALGRTPNCALHRPDHASA